jgi:hypothetical protein
VIVGMAVAELIRNMSLITWIVILVIIFLLAFVRVTPDAADTEAA